MHSWILYYLLDIYGEEPALLKAKQTNEHLYSSLVDVIFTLFYNKVTNIKNEKKGKVLLHGGVVLF